MDGCPKICVTDDARVEIIAIRGDDVGPYAYTIEGVDLTGARIRQQIRKGSTDGPLVYELDTDAGTITIDDAPNGKFTVDAIQTADLDPTLYFWDIEITPNTRTYIRGTLDLEPDTTRP